MIKNIEAKTILSTIKNGPDKYFGLSYNMNLYRGCQHGCIYCDSRSNCYGIENFSDILIKKNAIKLLQKELKSKKNIGTIGTGSMNDPYMPIEKELCITRKALEVINLYKFPIHIITKGDLIARDSDIIKEINKVYAAASITITTANDSLASIIEPNAPSPSKRFKAIEKLSKDGIYTGIMLAPVLPYITDNYDNIEEIVKRGKDAGAKYIIAWFGMTIREGQREYYFQHLNRNFPGLKERYVNNYKNSYFCPAPNYEGLYSKFKELCYKENIMTKMNFYKQIKPVQLSMFKD
ncbi:radical SAM protein [uncultured Clostridium sp.]|uniref:SPL family radical SAM protein n=1 Tax=uncultured Clostridium sp. TaxID=59620 RepID=UPI0028EC78D8|nr:radical SAM protein [uncultured Clostridium sp.]